jgi:energy-coupling factor transporter ATP-binding protein EcfA2
MRLRLAVKRKTIFSMTVSLKHLERNPFATRYVRPGAVDYHFMDGQSAEQLLERLRDSHWLGEIVGPHGSGKSTLLQSLIPLIQEAGRDVQLVTLHLGESELPISLDEVTRWPQSKQLIIDGYEQLSGSSRRQILKLCAGNHGGLLVTTHEPTGLPVVYSTAAEVDVVQALVRELQDGGPTRVYDADVAMSFERQQGNVRDVFFELYDIFEQRRPLV